MISFSMEVFKVNISLSRANGSEEKVSLQGQILKLDQGVKSYSR